ncbi:MAG: heavy metal translocating P-type ATPase [Bdellovibrionales bacterium]
MQINMDINMEHNLEASASDWTYLDRPVEANIYLSSTAPDLLLLRIEGVKCSGCIRNLESLVGHVSDLQSLEVSMGDGLLKIKKSSGGHFSKITEAITQLGYRITPLSHKDFSSSVRSAEVKALRSRFAVAAACMGNIMLLSVSIYAGMPKSYEQVFHWISLILVLPILFYSNLSFYQNIVDALKRREPHIDMPIVLALVGGSLLSIFNLLQGNNHIYFDSVAMLATLLLGSRLLLLSLQKKFLSSQHLSQFVKNQPIQVYHQGQYRKGFSDDLKKGDLFKIGHGVTLPVDAQLVETGCFVDPSLLTGETLPKWYDKGEIVQAGMKVKSKAFTCFQAMGAIQDTSLYKYILDVEKQIHGKSSIVKLADKIAKYFTLGIMTLSAFVLLVLPFWLSIDIYEGINRSLALIIVSCPCALAFATPLIESLALVGANRMGIFVKSANVFEKLRNIKTMFFDKTGTLTQGNHAFCGFAEGTLSNQQIERLVALEQLSQHPLARTLVNEFASSIGKKSVQNFYENHGEGVSGLIDGLECKISKYDKKFLAEPSAENGSQLSAYYENDDLKAVLQFVDNAVEDVDEVFSGLKQLGYKIKIISGDQEANLTYLQNKYAVEVFGDLKPSEKQQLVRNNRPSVMVGDGFNDLGAMGEADVSVAVQGSIAENLKFADVFIDKPGIGLVFQLVRLAHQVKKLTIIILGFSLIYNLVLGVLAVMGAIGPLAAALLMPLSSIAVVMISLVGMRNFSLVQRSHIESQNRAIPPVTLLGTGAVS